MHIGGHTDWGNVFASVGKLFRQTLHKLVHAVAALKHGRLATQCRHCYCWNLNCLQSLASHTFAVPGGRRSLLLWYDICVIGFFVLFRMFVDRNSLASELFALFNCDEESAFGKVVLVQRFSLLNSCNRFLTPTRSKWTVNSLTISLSNYVTPTICLLLAFLMIRFQCVTSYQKGPMIEHA